MVIVLTGNAIMESLCGWCLGAGDHKGNEAKGTWTALVESPEVTGQSLVVEMEQFHRQAPLPPDQVEIYIDTPERGFRYTIDPKIVVQHVWEYIRAVLDLKLGAPYSADQRRIMICLRRGSSSSLPVTIEDNA